MALWTGLKWTEKICWSKAFTISRGWFRSIDLWVMDSISACHAEDRGSIPRRGEFSITASLYSPKEASINQLMNEDATKRPLETLSDKRVPEPWQLKFRTVIIIISMTKLPRACFKSLKENYNQWPLQCAQRLHFWQTKSSKERNPFIFSILTGQTMSRNEKKVLGCRIEVPWA